MYVFLGDDGTEMRLKNHGPSAAADRLSQTVDLGSAITLDLTMADGHTLLGLAQALLTAAHRQDEFQQARATMTTVAVMPLHERGPETTKQSCQCGNPAMTGMRHLIDSPCYMNRDLIDG